jgi:hypothetical protein
MEKCPRRNAPKGIVKVSGAALLTSVKNSTQAKLNSWNNMPVPEVDIFEDAAKKLTIATIKKKVKLYHLKSPKRCSEINQMKRGSRDDPNTLTNVLITYWKENLTEPPEIINEEVEYNLIAKKIMKMTVDALREVLLEAYAGDVERNKGKHENTKLSSRHVSSNAAAEYDLMASPNSATS